jgi:hypothetical protein
VIEVRCPPAALATSWSAGLVQTNGVQRGSSPRSRSGSRREVLDAGEAAAADGLAGDDREEALDEVEPGPRGTGSGTPTVVLEPGGGEMSSNLGWIAPAVAVTPVSASTTAQVAGGASPLTMPRTARR